MTGMKLRRGELICMRGSWRVCGGSEVLGMFSFLVNFIVKTIENYLFGII
ncbi:MAG: hypothetical protein ACRC1M_04345 [Methanobacteriaceae archaeon]